MCTRICDYEASPWWRRSESITFIVYHLEPHGLGASGGAGRGGGGGWVVCVPPTDCITHGACVTI